MLKQAMPYREDKFKKGGLPPLIFAFCSRLSSVFSFPLLSSSVPHRSLAPWKPCSLFPIREVKVSWDIDARKRLVSQPDLLLAQ